MTIAQVIRQRNVALLWSAGLLSMTGDWVLLIALPYYAYVMTGSPLMTGAMFIAGAAPRLAFGSVAGVFVDRWDRRRTMIGCDLVRAALLLPLLAVATADQLWIVYAVVFAQEAVGQLFQPAKLAVIPSLVDGERLTAVNALDSASMGITRLVGPPLGGLVMAASGLTGVVAIDAASFLVSAALLALIRAPSTAARGPAEPPAKSPLRAAAGHTRAVWGEWLDGVRVVRSERAVTAIFAAMGLVMIGYGAIMVLLVVLVRDVLHGGAPEYGLFAAAQGAGALAGTLLIGQVGHRLPPARLFSVSLVACGLAFLLAFNTPTLPPALAGVTAAGLAMAGWMVAERTLLQSGVADRYRGRVLGAYGTTNGLLMLGGTAVASGLGGTIETAWLLSGAALLYIAAGFIAAGTTQRAGAARPPAGPASLAPDAPDVR
jgi:MFS family permease